MQAGTSWKRSNTKNQYLYNAGNELNVENGWYEMFYRGYDPAIGRMLQIDPYAVLYPSHSTYNYAVNNPVYFNDPDGGKVNATGLSDHQLRALYRADLLGMSYSDFDDWASKNVTGSSWDNSDYDAPRVYNRWCACSVNALDILAYDGHGQNSTYRAQAQAAVDKYNDDEIFLRNYILKNFGDEVRSLNKLASEKDKRVTWFIDRKSKYTKLPLVARVMDIKEANKVSVVINWYALAKNESSPHFLYLTIAHELVHVRDVLEGRWDFWEKFYDEHYSNIITEYRAFERSGALERTLGVDYGHYDSFLSYRNQLPPGVIWDP